MLMTVGSLITVVALITMAPDLTLITWTQSVLLFFAGLIISWVGVFAVGCKHRSLTSTQK